MIDRELLVACARQYAAVLGDSLPACNEKIRAEAEHAVNGEIHYTDGQYVSIGRADIDWTGNQIQEHVWKERPKRFLYFPPLISAYRETGDERYAEAARDYLADWIRANPSAPDWIMPSHDNGLNLGIRIPFFAQALVIFAASPAWNDEFAEQVLADIDGELRYIGGHLSPKGNFRMKQAMTLIEIALRLPFMPAAGDWRKQGVAVMNDAVRRQVLPDGVHVECTAGYHTWMTRLFADCIKLQKTFPELGLTPTVEMVASMWDYSLASTRPNGSFCGVFDSEGDWEGSHENTVLSPRAEFRRAHDLPDTLPPTHQVFPVAGQAFLRDGWEEDATYLTFDATRWGSAHGHLSRNAIQLHAFGRTLLMDPGRISYEMSNPLGPYAKSTRAHTTLNLNGWNQFTTNPDEFRAFHAPGFDCMSSRYTGGYWPGPFGWWFYEGLGQGLAATHTRHLFWVHGRWAVVIDEVTRWNEAGRGVDYESPSLELNWQFSPGTLEIDAAQRRVLTRNADANLLLCFAQAPDNAEIEMHEGEENPSRGWIWDNTRFAGIPAPQVSLVCHPWKGHVETLVSLLVPYRGTAVPEFETEVIPGDVQRGLAARLIISWPDGSRETVSWTPGLDTMLGRCEDADTDGLLLYRRDDADAASGTAVVAAVDASYVNGLGEAALLLPADGQQKCWTKKFD